MCHGRCDCLLLLSQRLATRSNYDHEGVNESTHGCLANYLGARLEEACMTTTPGLDRTQSDKAGGQLTKCALERTTGILSSINHATAIIQKDFVAQTQTSLRNVKQLLSPPPVLAIPGGIAMPFQNHHRTQNPQNTFVFLECKKSFSPLAQLTLPNFVGKLI